MSNIITTNNYAKYDVNSLCEVYKARDTICTMSDIKQYIQLNDYGHTVNAINYAAIKYLTDKYDFIRSSFVDFRGNWATKIKTSQHDCRLTLLIDRITYQFCNVSECYFTDKEEELFVNAIDDLMMHFNGIKTVSEIPSTLNSKPTSLFPFWDSSQKQKENKKGRRIDVTSVPLHWAYNPEHMVPKSKIIMQKLQIEFNVKSICGKKYYYIDNLFMVDENSKYSWNKTHFEYKPNTVCNGLQTNNIDLSTYRNTTYDTLFTMLIQVPGVLNENDSVCKNIIDHVMYKKNKLEHYLNDANISTGYKIF